MENSEPNFRFRLSIISPEKLYHLLFNWIFSLLRGPPSYTIIMSDLNLSIGTLTFDTDGVKEALQAAKAAGIKEVDTAEMYGDGQNEADLGAASVGSMGLAVSTKSLGGWAKGVALQPENLIKSINSSLARLKVDQVDIFYIHGPDRSMKLDEWVPTLDQLYREGKFKRFGVSNFSANETRELHDYCKAKGFALPTVYQGNYNAVSRTIESTLFPVLRELGITFYVYSAMAGGFLTKSRAAIEAGTETGRFATTGPSLNSLYRGMYMKPSLLSALDTWEELAKAESVSKAELAYRWVYYHSKLDPKLGDTLIVGASKVTQIPTSVEGLKRGPLKAETSRKIEEMWEEIKHEAIVDNFDATQK